MLVCAIWASGLRKTYAITLAFETGKQIMGAPPVSNKTKVIFALLCLRLHTLYQRDQTLTEFAPHPNLS